MNDLTHRLRQWAISTDATPASDLMEAAADEIDRLGQALKKASNPNALLAAYQLGVRHSNEQSPSGSGIGGTSVSAPERQSPAGDRDGGRPLDDCAPTRDHAPGGRGHHTQGPVAWRVYATDGSEVVYSLYEQARAAADDLNWGVEPLYRSGENTPDPHATPGEGTPQPVAWAVLRIDGSVYDVYRNEEEAKAIDEAVTGNHGVVPLYRSPPTCPYVVGRTTLHCSLTPFTLTYKEREYIICQANRAWHNASEADARGDADWAKWHRDEERTLRSLLERTK